MCVHACVCAPHSVQPFLPLRTAAVLEEPAVSERDQASIAGLPHVVYQALDISPSCI